MSSPYSQGKPSKIFISYRRSESAAYAGRLSDQLRAHFGSQIIFIDVESIEPGRDFVEAIEDAVSSCKILLVVIGRQWLTCANERGRRLDDPSDFVRLEIAAALKRGVRVIPVLIQGVTMPREEDLPDEIAPLARRQAWDVSDIRWNQDVGKLIEKIARDVPGIVQRSTPEPESAERFISDLADAFRRKRWVKIFSLIGVVSTILLNPVSVGYGLKLLSFPKASWYSYPAWIIITALFFIAAFLFALLTANEEKKQPLPPISIIKGLLPYTTTREDVEWFAKLQRGSILHECMSFCLGADSSLAVLSGESGTGKTSFLQAGLVAGLNERGLHPVYVKLTASPPLDTISQSLGEDGKKFPPDDQQSLLELLRQATQSDTRPLILILDQFEQFFAHNKSKASRRIFIKQVAEWYRSDRSLPVKILVAIRGDFADRLFEFQKEMDYALTPHNRFRLEKLEPQEAVAVIRVIAEEVKIEFDEGFVKELTRRELADREDGGVSPIDIQILSWMLAGQKGSEERAFNRRAFQKLGGVEGLLERFLKRALGVRETEGRRQAAIKVMLALTDYNVRASALSLKELKEKLRGVVPDKAVEEAVMWLARGEVRLVTSVREKNVTRYELAHERIIPPLRRMAFKEITAVEEAQQTLDRRFNEWVGNSRTRRYLLTLRDWWRIRRNWALLTLGPQKEQLEDFVSLSKKRFTVNGLIVVFALLLGFGGYAGYGWYERRPQTRIYRAQNHLDELLEGNKDNRAILSAAFLLPALDAESNQRIPPKLWQQIEGLSPTNQTVVLGRVARIYGKYGRQVRADVAARRLDKVLQAADKLDLNNKAHVLVNLAEACSELPETEETTSRLIKVRLALDEVWQATENLSHADKSWPLRLLAEAYSKLPKYEGTLSRLSRIRRAAEDLDPFNQIHVLVHLAKAHQGLPKTGEAIDESNKVQSAIDKIRQVTEEQPSLPDRYVVLILVISAYSNLEDTRAAVSGLDKVRQASDYYEPADKLRLLSSVSKALGGLSKSDGAMECLDKIQQELDEGWQQAEKIDIQQIFALMEVAGAYGKLPDTDVEVSHSLSQLEGIRRASERLDRYYQPVLLRALAEAYALLPKTNESIDGLDKVQQEFDKAWQTTGKLENVSHGHALRSLAKAYGTFTKTDMAVSRLDKVRQATEKLVVRDHSLVFFSLAMAYHKLGKNDEALKYLAQARQAANEELTPNFLPDVATLYAKLHRWEDALETAQSIRDKLEQVEALSNVLIIWRDARNGTRSMDAFEELFSSNPFSPPPM